MPLHDPTLGSRDPNTRRALDALTKQVADLERVVTHLERERLQGVPIQSGDSFPRFAGDRRPQWELLEHKDLNAAIANVPFDVPSQGYIDLRFTLRVKTDQASDQPVNLAFNQDTTAANYFRAQLVNFGGAATAGTANDRLVMHAAATTANRRSGGTITVFDYLSYMNKHAISQYHNQAASTFAGGQYLLWFGGGAAAPVYQVAFAPAVGNFVAGSSFTMEGLPYAGNARYF